jgi:hypothetical protein
MLIWNQIQSLKHSKKRDLVKNTVILRLKNYFSNPFFKNAHKGRQLTGKKILIFSIIKAKMSTIVKQN